MKNKFKRKIKYNLHLKIILFLIVIFYLPKLLHPTIMSTTIIFKNFINVFLNFGVYSMSFLFLLNAGLIFIASCFLLGEDLKLNKKIILAKKRTFLRLFFGYFIYSYFLISILVEKSFTIQQNIGRDPYDIVYSMTFFSLILILLLVYFNKKNVCIGKTNMGSFIFFLLGSTIIFEAFIGFSPLTQMYNVLINYQIIENNIAVRILAPYYFSFLGSIILSIIDLRFFRLE